MLEIEKQVMPENYYSVDVAGLASFVICAADEDFAFLRLREYCKDNAFLSIDPDSHFDIFNKVITIDSDDAEHLRRTQIGQNIVRLKSFTETNVIDYVPERTKDMRIDAPTQLEMFL